MNILSSFFVPAFTLSRLKFFYAFLVILASFFGLAYMYEKSYWDVMYYTDIDIPNNEVILALTLLIPIYAWYAVLMGRYNEIDKYQLLVKIFALGAAFTYFIFSSEVLFHTTIDISDDNFFYVMIACIVNLIFGLALVLFGIFKKGQVLEQHFLVFVSNGIGRLSRDDVKKVDKNHHPDFSTNGLLVVHEGKLRTFTSEIDYDLVQPANLNGAQMFEFSLSSVK